LETKDHTAIGEFFKSGRIRRSIFLRLFLMADAALLAGISQLSQNDIAHDFTAGCEASRFAE